MDGNKQRQPETVYSFWLPFFGAKRCACLPCFAASYDASMDKELNPLTGDYTGRAVKNLQNAVYIRLRTPLGTWWADKSIGSLLHLLQREKDVARVGLLAEQCAMEALQPIVDDGRARQISVSATQPHNGWLLLRIRVETAQGGFDYNHRVPIV